MAFKMKEVEHDSAASLFAFGKEASSPLLWQGSNHYKDADYLLSADEF